MKALKRDPGDDWCNLTSDELRVELIRGLEKVTEGMEIIQEGEGHATLAAFLLREREVTS
jgi:hypothetical protein